MATTETRPARLVGLAQDGVARRRGQSWNGACDEPPGFLPPEVRPISLNHSFNWIYVGEPPGTRTPNPQIKSLLLYQLS